MENSGIQKCRKYFIFKIQDLVNNSYHTLEEKKQESLLKYIEVCIDTYDELRMSLDQSKLNRSYEGLLEGLDAQLQKHPFRLLDLYKDDFSRLHCLLKLTNGKREKENEKENGKGPEIHNIHRNLVALKKKLEAENLIERYIECLLTEQIFSNMDYLMEALVSDLLNMGYSMAYIVEYFKNQQGRFVETGDCEQIIRDMKNLNKTPVGFKIFIKYKVGSETQQERARELLGRHFELVSEEILPANNQWMQDGWQIATKVYQALDAYKAIDMARKEFQSIKQFFDMWQATQNFIRDDIWYAWEDETGFHKIGLGSVDNTRMLSYIDNNYRKQMERFLQLEKSVVNENKGTLERVLYTLHTAKGYSIQNRFLNFWSSLEYILHPFPKYTIIEKARVIVPEVFSLFYLKNKLNIFWSRLTYCMEKKGYKEKYSALDFFCTDCREGKDYSTRKVISYLLDKEKYTPLLSELSFHIVLERECKELIMLLTEPQKASKAIKGYYEEIRHDLNYIYRLRNQLIHSARDIDDSLEYISFRLYRYVNSVLSTILYYEEKNNAYSIIDILSSIDATYQNYSSKLSIEEPRKKQNSKEKEGNKITEEEGYRLVRPKYLFLE